MQRSPTRKNVWSPSMRPWSCCRQLTWRRCDTSWLTSRGLNSVTRHELQVVKDSSVQLKEAFCLIPSMSQGDPEWEGESDVQREPGHCVRSNADEGSRAGRHDGAERHPIPETCGGKPHHQWRCALLRGVKQTLAVRRGWRIRLGRLLTSSVLLRFMTLNKINDEETCKNQESGLAWADKQKKNTTCF